VCFGSLVFGRMVKTSVEMQNIGVIIGKKLAKIRLCTDSLNRMLAQFCQPCFWTGCRTESPPRFAGKRRRFSETNWTRRFADNSIRRLVSLWTVLVCSPVICAAWRRSGLAIGDHRFSRIYCTVELGPGQATRIHVPMLPSSIIWYQHKLEVG